MPDTEKRCGTCKHYDDGWCTFPLPPWLLGGFGALRYARHRFLDANRVQAGAVGCPCWKIHPDAVCKDGKLVMSKEN